MNEPRADGVRSAPHEILNGVTIRRFGPSGRIHGVLSRMTRSSAGRRLTALIGSQEAVQLWAGSPYGLAPAMHAVRSRPDVVAVINWYGAWLPYQLCLARRLRRFSFVGVPLFHTDVHWAKAPVQAKMLRCCDAVVAMTEHERAFMATATDKGYAIGVGVDPAAFQHADGRAVRARYGIGDAPLVGYVGRMDAAKGIDVLIQAMQAVWRSVPAARLMLAGGAASQSGGTLGFSSMLDSLPPSDRARIVLTGRFADEDKASLFDALDVFAMPSLAESFGIAYLEAWMRTKPVIGARLGATEFVIDDGVDGDLVAPGDADELAASILRLLADPDRRVRMGAAGHAKTMSRFSWVTVTDAVERLYRQSCDQSVPPIALESEPSAATVQSGRDRV